MGDSGAFFQCCTFSTPASLEEWLRVTMQLGRDMDLFFLNTQNLNGEIFMWQKH